VSYGILWPDPALADLADAYLSARSDDFNRAVEFLEAELVRDPATAGESRAGPSRIVYDLPASILHRVDDSAQVVDVLTVRYHS
jgi:hypothetical protein